MPRQESLRLSPEHRKMLGPDHIAAYQAADEQTRAEWRDNAIYARPELAEAYESLDTQLGKRRAGA